MCIRDSSNTLSFVRIGAYAVSHAAMMQVVLMLAGAENGSPNWVVIVLGNIFVCGLEGLIVGIQVLRLEYYEMFSRCLLYTSPVVTAGNVSDIHFPLAIDGFPAFSVFGSEL